MSKKVVIDEENPSAEAMALIASAISGQAHEAKTNLEGYSAWKETAYLHEAYEALKAIGHLYNLLERGLAKERAKRQREDKDEIEFFGSIDKRGGKAKATQTMKMILRYREESEKRRQENLKAIWRQRKDGEFD